MSIVQDADFAWIWLIEVILSCAVMSIQFSHITIILCKNYKSLRVLLRNAGEFMNEDSKWFHTIVINFFYCDKALVIFKAFIKIVFLTYRWYNLGLVIEMRTMNF